MFERELRDLAFVPRWGIVRTIRQQNVAEHSFYVAIYADMIAESIGWQGDRAQLFRLTLSHDWDEIFTSDIAAPAKRVLKKAAGPTAWDKFTSWLLHCSIDRFADFLRWTDPALFGDAERSVQAHDILKAADILEAVMYLAEEENFGNRNVADRRVLLEEQLHSALQSVRKFAENKVGFHMMEQKIMDAVSRQARGSSKVVTGSEMP